MWGFGRRIRMPEESVEMFELTKLKDDSYLSIHLEQSWDTILK